MTLAVAAPLVVSGTAIAGGDKGKGDERPETAPGQVKPDGERAQPTHPNGKAEGHDRTTKASKGKSQNKGHKYGHNKSAKPNKSAAKGAKGGNPSKPSGKTTICHATGSDSNPYVTITVSNNALKAHDRHQNDEDIIPAPEGGCPTTAPAPAAASTKGSGNGKAANGKTTICHATGSDSNPFVTITVSNNALKAHDRHQNDEDIIPAPAEGCPAPAAAAAGKTEAMGAPPATAPAVTALAPAAAPAGAVLGETATGNVAAPTGAVLGETAAGTTRREAGAEGAVASGTLPFTGADIWLLVIVGLGALLAGVALHRSLGSRGTV